MSRTAVKKGKKLRKLYVCGRCGYRAHHRMKCHSCGFMLEEECLKCFSAKGNCICKFHGFFVKGKQIAASGKKKKKKG